MPTISHIWVLKVIHPGPSRTRYYFDWRTAFEGVDIKEMHVNENTVIVEHEGLVYKLIREPIV